MPLSGITGPLHCAPAPNHGRVIEVCGRAEGAALDAIAMVSGRHSSALSVATPGVSGAYLFSIRQSGGLRIMTADANLVGNILKFAKVTAIDEDAGTVEVTVTDEASVADTLEADEYICLTVKLDSI